MSTSNKFYDTAKIGLRSLKVTRKPNVRGRTDQAVQLPDGRMAAVLLL
jgi:hypothetical protein